MQPAPKTAAIEPFQYAQSRALIERANQVIPNGIYGHFNPASQVPEGAYPFFGAKAKGSRFWDVDGNEFVDYTCAYGPMILGYGHPAVDEAYAKQLKEANATTLASPAMVELAEYLVDLIPVADWAFFAKNGADVTNFAVMIARAATGREKIIAISGGYHGATPWMQGAGRPGVLESDQHNVLWIPWNDADALERVLIDHPGEIAAFISSPYHHPVYQDNALPTEGYWKAVEQLLTKNGVVLISDDVRSGFRIDMAGSHEHFGFKPDLVCYCKALANGYPISALVGSDVLRAEAAKVFQTGSFWFSAAPMAAALACLNEIQQSGGPARLLETGRRLTNGMIDIAKNHGHVLNVTGMPSMPYMRLLHEDGIRFHRAVCGACTQRGAFFTSHHNWFLSLAHTGDDLQRTWDIFDSALASLRS